MTQAAYSPGWLRKIERRLKSNGATETSLLAILDLVLQQFDCAVGTIHAFDPTTGLLRLRAQRGIPDSIREPVECIPVGKGMAGLAAERRAPVQVCNLQTDTSGVAKPGAKETKMEGSLAVPIMDGDNLRGVLGVAKAEAYQFDEQEIASLQQAAAVIAKFVLAG